MSVFQQFRLWARRAPIGERVTAGVATALVLAVLAWLLVPPDHAKSSVNVSAGSAGKAGSAGTGNQLTPGAADATTTTVADAGGAAGAAATAAGGTGGAASASGAAAGSSGGGAATSGGGGGSGGAAGCQAPPGSDQGVSSTQIKIAIVLLNIVGPAANSSFGVEQPSQQQAQYEAMIDSINSTGGIACRKVVATFYTGDPVDTAGLQSLCTTIIQSKPFFVLDYGAYYTNPQIATCYPQAQLPFYSSQIAPVKQINQFYPYYLSKETKEMLYRDTALALGQRGMFKPENGFKKLGIIYSDCVPEIPGEAFGYFQEAGVAPAQMSKFNVGCSNSFTSPSVLQQAIVQFKTDGVTHVTGVNDNGDFGNFTTLAQQQGFKPVYGLADDGIVPTVNGAQHPDYNNIANAIAITPDRFAEENTQGMSPDETTKKCDDIMTAHGQPTSYKSPAGASGQACNNLWLIKAAVEHAPALQRNALAAGLKAAGSVQYSYPYGPNNFTGQNVTYGGEAWRVVQFMPTCNCFQVVDPTFHPPFP